MTDLENLPSDVKHALSYYKRRVADLELAALIAQFDVSQLTDKYNKLAELFQKQSKVFESDREELSLRIKEYEKIISVQDLDRINKKFMSPEILAEKTKTGIGVAEVVTKSKKKK